MRGDQIHAEGVQEGIGEIRARGGVDEGLGGGELLPLDEPRAAGPSRKAREEPFDLSSGGWRRPGRGGGRGREAGEGGRSGGSGVANPGVPEAGEGARLQEAVESLLDPGGRGRGVRAPEPPIHRGRERSKGGKRDRGRGFRGRDKEGGGDLRASGDAAKAGVLRRERDVGLRGIQLEGGTVAFFLPVRCFLCDCLHPFLASSAKEDERSTWARGDERW